jgi:hypothetical protein
MSTSIQNLSQMTGMSEVELQRRTQEFVATGKLKGLSALDQQLLAQTTGPQQKTVDAFGAMATASQEPHALEEPAQVLGHVTANAGFAPEATANGSLVAANAPAVLDRASATAQHKMAGFFAVSGANGSQGTIGGQAKSQSAFDAINSAISGIDVTALEKGDSGSRELAFEKLKLSMQRISEGMQALTNTLSMTHESAKTAINNLKA